MRVTWLREESPMSSRSSMLIRKTPISSHFDPLTAAHVLSKSSGAKTSSEGKESKDRLIIQLIFPTEPIP